MRVGRSGASRGIAAAVIALLLAAPLPASAHPVPFSYLDLRVSPGSVDGSLVLHVIDVAHELGIEPADRLLDLEFAKSHDAAIEALLAGRLAVTSRERLLHLRWTVSDVLPDRQSIRLRAVAATGGPASQLSVAGVLFPYDANHKTFVNLYDGEELSQAILDVDRPRHSYFAGTAAGRLAAVGTFLRSAVPTGLAPVPPQAALPVLPIFNVNLYVRRGVVAPVIEELALHIRRWLPLLPAAA